MVIKRLTSLILAIISVAGLWAQKKGAPDFAYPKTVEKNADNAIRHAMASGDSPALIEGAVQWSLAKARVSSDSIPAVLTRLSELGRVTTDPAARALLDCLKATIYASAYSNNRYKYDRREFSAAAGEDFELWSTENFARRVDSLTMASLVEREALTAIPITEYSRCLDLKDIDLKLYPTLYDFIGTRGIENLKMFATSSATLNPELVTDCDNSRLYPALGTPTGDILRIYRSLAASTDNDLQGPAHVNYLLELITIINDHAFYTDASQAFPEAMMREYRRLIPRIESAVRFLLAINSGYDPSMLYNELTLFSKEHPQYADINAVKNRINNLARKEVSLEYSQNVMPGKPFEVRILARNAGNIKINLYDVTSLVSRSESSISLVKKQVNRSNPLLTRTVELSGEVPFSSDTTITMTVPQFGRFILLTEVDGKPYDRNWVDAIYATALAPATLDAIPRPLLVALDPLTGEPQQDVEFSFLPWRRDTGFRPLAGKTDSNGFLFTESQSDGGRLLAQRGDDRYGPETSMPGRYRYSSGREIWVDLITPLNLYHPGDSVQWAAAAFSRPKESRSAEIASDIKLQLYLYDANGQEQAKAIATTDSWGRAEGSFVLPVGGLQGNYRIEARYETAGNNMTAGNTWFTVSDYRLPTFRIEELAARAPREGDGEGVISGKALTFAGFPVADGKVEAQLKVRSGVSWFYSLTSPVFATVKGTTDADGSFSLAMPAEMLNGSPAPSGLFLVSVTVTAPDGETQEASTQFNRGKPLAITASIPDIIDVSGTFKAAVDALDYKGEKSDITLLYTIEGDNCDATIPVRKGSVASGNVDKLLRALPTGRYTARFAAADSILAAPLTGVSFTIYSPDSKLSPMKSPVWVPRGQVVADEKGRAVIVYGSDCDNNPVWLTVTDTDGHIIENRWLRSRKGMQSVTVTLPDSTLRARASLSAVRDYRTYSNDVTILPASSQRKIDLAIETFRDRVTPGDLEKIVFRIKPTNGADTQSAVMTSLTNMALERLKPGSLSIDVPTIPDRFNSFTGWNIGTAYTGWSSNVKSLPTRYFGSPEWNLYGLRFYGNGLMIRGSHTVSRVAGAPHVVYKLNDYASFDSDTGAGSANVTAAPAMAMKAADGALAEEAVVTEEETEGSTIANATEEQTYRPAEVPLGFFRPMLTTEPDGTLDLTYRVPDANTTWILRAAAYNRTLDTATASKQITASKPLMVNLNAPHFVRTGDRVTIPATVMNATDSVCSPTGSIEILDQGSGTVLASRAFSLDSINGGSQATVSLDFAADILAPALIVRVKASAGNFTDGEQQLVAVLPAQQDVMESRIFYIPSDSALFAMELSPLAAGGKAMLNFTENPTWQVVSALPGLRDHSINSSIEAAHNLFSAAVARGLVQRYPEVARTLRRWSDNPADSALVSPLLTNSELRQVLLDATPWVQEALTDNQRLQRLALLLDRHECDKVTAEAIDLLAKTAAPDGGWYWTARYPKVSSWATEEVLLTLGLLNKMGWLPDDDRLTRMVQNGCRYFDRTTTEEFSRYPRSDYSLYTYIRTLFPAEKQSTAARRVSNTEVQRCIADWKKGSLQKKALSALILSAEGYPATAKQIIESLTEYSTCTPEKGMWWQQLDHTSWFSLDRVGQTSLILQAYHAVQPRSAAVDRIRQWLVLQKQNTAWGSSAVTTMVVASILTTGSEWTVNPGGTAIHVGDKLLQPTEVQYATGEFTADISAGLSSGALLTIDRQANYPSAGSVVTLERKPMSDVKAVGCAEATIEKSLRVYRDGEWIEANTFQPGDRVRVTLTVTADDDLDYIVITDPRPSGFEPAEQLPEPVWSDATCFYRENRDSSTNLYIDRLRRGSYILSYELFATRCGVYTSGAAALQSQYNPIVAAHSSGSVIVVKSDE